MSRTLPGLACFVLLTAQVTASPQDDFEALMELARTQLGAANFAAALATLESAAALRPAAPEVAYGRGIALAELGRPVAALDALEQLVGSDPGHANGWALLGKVFAEQGDLSALLRATEAYENAVALRQADPRFLLALCRTYARLGMSEAALTVLDAYEGKPGTLLRLERARMLSKQGELREARMVLEQLSREGGGAQVHYELAQLLENLGEWDAAADEYEAALRAGPRFGQAWLAAGNLFAKRQNYEQAVARLSRAVEIFPQRSDAHRSLGVAMVRSGQAVEGLAQLRRAVELAPDKPRGLRDLAAALAAGDADKEARELVARAADLDREQRRATMEANRAAELGLLTTRGLYHYRRDNYAEAVELLQIAANLGPEDGLVHFNLGLALAASGAHEEAIAALESSRTLAPERPETYIALARSYRAVGRATDADAMEQRARDLSERSDMLEDRQ